MLNFHSVRFILLPHGLKKFKKLEDILKSVMALAFILFHITKGISQQSTDSVRNFTYFSGSFGITNNGFSIIPTFSLNSPATITQLSWKKGNFSIDPDVRLSLDARKGSVLLWFRFQAIKTNRFHVRAGIHPAMNLQIRKIAENGVSSEITQMRRFIAWELTPTLTLNKHFSLNLYYLQGNGLQHDGPRTSHFINLSAPVSNIAIGGRLQFSFIPAWYYLNLDGFKGTYFTSTSILKHASWPFSLQSSLNKTITSNIPANRDFMWNVSLHYHFATTYKRNL